MVGRENSGGRDDADVPGLCRDQDLGSGAGRPQDLAGCAETLAAGAFAVRDSADCLDAAGRTGTRPLADPIRACPTGMGGAALPAHPAVHFAGLLHREPTGRYSAVAVGSDRPISGCNGPQSPWGRRTREQARSEDSARETDIIAPEAMARDRRRHSFISVPLRGPSGRGPAWGMGASRQGRGATGNNPAHVAAYAGDAFGAGGGEFMGCGRGLGDDCQDVGGCLRTPPSRFSKARGRCITVPMAQNKSDYAMVSMPADFHARTAPPRKPAIYRVFSMRTDVNLSRTEVGSRAMAQIGG